MALSRLTITFNEDLVATEQISFDIYNTVTLTTESVPYVWVNDNRTTNEVLISGFTSIIVGGATSSDLYNAIIYDYLNSNDFSVSIFENSIILQTKSEDLAFLNANTHGNDIDFEVVSVPSPIPPTGTSYFFEFEDVEDILHRVEIAYSPNVDEWVEITGDCSLDYPDVKEAQEAIKPCSLTINLLATEDLTFSDLYTEEERVYKVSYTRDGVQLFNGWLSADGLYENFVHDKWYLELNCIDGLGYLKELSYVENETGLNFIGRQSALETITNCLKRTNLTNGIRTSVNIYYTGLSGVDVLDNVYFNSERYLKDDDETYMDSEEVLRSILEGFNASITFRNGYWYVYRSNELFNESDINFYEYDNEGVYVQMFQEDLSILIGSQRNGFYPHHVNGNQKKSLERSLGAYRLNLQWGEVFSYYTNTSLIWNSDVDIDEWTINIPVDVKSLDGRGFYMERNSSGISVVLTSDTYTVSADSRMQFSITFSNMNTDNPFFKLGATVNAKVVYVKGGNTYWLNKNGSWGGDTLIQHAIAYAEADFTLTVISDVLPESDGDVYIQIYSPGFNDAKSPILITKVLLQTYSENEQPKGKNYTIEKRNNPSPNTNSDIKEVFNGDVDDGTYYATIYKNDEVTETTTWNRQGVTEEKELLRIMAEDRMKMALSPRIVFEGDLYGYIPYLSVVNIDNVNGKFLPIDYNYNPKYNVTSIKYIQILNSVLLDGDILYTSNLDYGNVVKPTIK